MSTEGGITYIVHVFHDLERYSDAYEVGEMGDDGGDASEILPRAVWVEMVNDEEVYGGVVDDSAGRGGPWMRPQRKEEVVDASKDDRLGLVVGDGIEEGVEALLQEPWGCGMVVERWPICEEIRDEGDRHIFVSVERAGGLVDLQSMVAEGNPVEVISQRSHRLAEGDGQDERTFMDLR